MYNRLGNIISTITLCDTNSEWGVAAQDNQALYFTKYMRDPIKTEPGDAKPLLIFTVDEAERLSKPLIRCDALVDEPAMVAHYKHRLGFTEKGRTIYQIHGKEGILLETPTSDLAVRLRAATGQA